MSDYGQVIMEHSGVCMYQRFGGMDLPKMVQRVLAEYKNWDNEDYLTKMICQAMMVECGNLNILGISGKPIDNPDVDIIINTEYKTVTIGDVTCTFVKYIESDLAFLEVAQ